MNLNAGKTILYGVLWKHPKEKEWDCNLFTTLAGFESNLKMRRQSLLPYIEVATFEISAEEILARARKISGEPVPLFIEGINSIIKAVAKSFNLEVSNLKMRKRDAELVLARQVAMYLLWNNGDYTLRQIGRELGGRTPATVSHGFQRIANRINTDPALKDKILQIKEG